MRKLVYFPFCRMAVCLGIFVIYSIEAKAQVPLYPSTWEGYVNGYQNVLKRDTFLMQTFNATPTDNWEYTMTGGAKLFDAATKGIQGASDGTSMKLPAGATLRLAPFQTTPHYSDVTVVAPFAVYKAQPGENLHLLFDDDGKNQNVQWTNVTGEEYTAHFKEPKTGSPMPKSSAAVAKGRMSWFDLSVTSSDTSDEDHFYAVDSIYAIRELPAYSLFKEKEKGNWQDTVCWSHYPAFRRRHALIKGDVMVTSDVSCASCLLGEGSITVQQEASLVVDRFFLDGSRSYLYALGEVEVRDSINYEFSFAAIGEWYFFSFPFDVYSDEVDPNFRLQSDPTVKNNLYHVIEYDGIQRSEQGMSARNWRPIPASAAKGTDPIFKKGRGYLIALDTKGTIRDMMFTHRSNRGPIRFTREERIPINVAEQPGENADEHHGWFFCGNPLPAPLPLTAIEPNANLDGYIYVYEGKTFKPYPIGSEKILPPFATFFVKAKQKTTLVIRQKAPVNPDIRLDFTSPVLYTGGEPSDDSSLTDNQLPATTFKYVITKAGIQVENLPDSGSLSVVDLTGRVLHRQALADGSSFIPLALPSGIYLLQIESGSERAQYKFIWNK